MENFMCSNCEVSLSRTRCLFVQCEECLSDGLDVKLCASCFRMGAECGPHKRGHAYTVDDYKGPPLFRSKTGKQWGWKEDLSLIRAARKHKLGNWEEIASDLDSGKTSSDAKRHFDRYFVRGAFGRYALGHSLWPRIEDFTEGEVCLPHSDPDLSGQGHVAESSSNWLYIAEFFRTYDRTVDFNLPNWFSEFEDDLLKFRNEVNIPPTLSPPVKSDIDDEHSFEQQYDSSVIVTPPMSPVFVDFFRADDRGGRKRLLSVSDFDESDDEATSNSGNSSVYEYRAELTTSYKHERSSSYEAVEYLNSSCGLQSTEDEDSEIEDVFEKKKPILRLKRVGRKWRKKDDGKRTFLKEAYKGKLMVGISDDVKERLLELYPEQFYANVPLLPFCAEERSKLKDDDLQLLAYMPEREDFEWEFNNDAERLISRIMVQTGNDADEDTAFEMAVKLAKVQKYNRSLKQRKAKKAVVREYELVNKFFDKIKKVEETRRSLIYNQQYLALARRQERFHSLMKKAYQVAKRSELEQLLDAVTGYVTLNEKIMDLESLKADGVKDLKGRGKVINDRWKGKRRRRPLHSNDIQRKAHLRWKRFKRWTMQQANEYGSVESDA